MATKKTENKETKNPRFAVYQKYNKKKDTKYYWASVKGTDKDNETIYANIFVRMSKKAADQFEDDAEDTNTKGITRVYAEITDGWLKAIPGKEYNNVCLFINDFETITDDEDEKE